VSFITGVACDNCGTSDIAASTYGLEIDKFPRNGWLSVCSWEGEEEGSAQPEMHFCSIECIYGFAAKVLETNQKNNDSDHGHGHDHTH
jgi:hypothetical protein